MGLAEIMMTLLEFCSRAHLPSNQYAMASEKENMTLPNIDAMANFERNMTLPKSNAMAQG